MDRKIYLLFLISLLLIIDTILITLGNEKERKPVDNENFEIKSEIIARNLEVPWDLDFAPDGRIFITERPGRIRTIVNGNLNPDPQASLSAFSQGEVIVQAGGTLPPSYAKTRFLPKTRVKRVRP